MIEVRSVSGSWRAGGPAVAWAVTGLVLVLVGLLAGRPQVVSMGVPLVIGAVWSWLHRPTGPAELTMRDCRYRPETGMVEAELCVVPSSGVATTRIRVGSLGHRPVDAVLASAIPRAVRLGVSGVRTGRRQVFSAVHFESGPDHIVRSEPQEMGPVDVTVLPRTQMLNRLPLPFRLQGLTGAHDSRRIGDGGEFHDISLFTSGDRLRRIDWRVTARRSMQGRGTPPGLSQLYVRRSHATADAVVMLVVDSRDDIGPDASTWAGGPPVHPDDPTSLDIAREAAGSLARRYLDVGDRVGVVDVGRSSRALRPAGGRRHLHRVLHQLADAHPDRDVRRRVRAPQMPSGAMVVVFSTFLDDEAMQLGEMWRAGGHRVLAVDVMPPPDVARLLPHVRTAQRIIEIERQDRLWRLARSGVEVIPWSGDGPDGRSLMPGLAASVRRRGGRR